MLKIKFFLVLFLLTFEFAYAHETAKSYLILDSSAELLTGRLEISVLDLEQIIGLDANLDGAIRWGEVQSSQTRLQEELLSRVELTVDNKIDCRLQLTNLEMEKRLGVAYVSHRFSSVCPAKFNRLDINYQVIFEHDAQHTLLVLTQSADEASAHVVSIDNPVIGNVSKANDMVSEFYNYIYQGIIHIAIGYDHLLFLFSLLLAAPLRYINHRYLPSESITEVVVTNVKIVTTFTVAHSISLLLAAYEWVKLDLAAVELLIAVSVVLAALNNIYPVVRKKLLWVIFTFGLFHGLGFASVLFDLGISATYKSVAVLGFNLGVEIGQLLIVALLVPMLYTVRKHRLYQGLILKLGSFAVMSVALVWVMQRSGWWPVIEV